jgi:GntP family gluconate:H+ symporter
MVANAPSLSKSILPILIPILLIVGKSMWDFYNLENKQTELFAHIIGFLGTPTIALLIGMVLSFTLPERWDTGMLSNDGWVGKSMKDAASILLITGAGGIFGTMLQNSGIAQEITGIIEGRNLGIWLLFILCAAIKTAQGSSTVALITTASIMAPLMITLGLEGEMEKALTVSAIGAGALVVSHANDSAFWVMTQMSGLDTKTGYKAYTLGTLVVGLFAALIIFLLSFFL